MNEAAISGEQRVRRRAAKANLVYINAPEDGFTRRRCGRGFTYLTTTGQTVRSKRTRARIDALAIPPAWEDVYICPEANGHIQAAGYDEAGRRQYIYHERWRAISEATKFDRMNLLAELLPRIRRRVRRDLNEPGLSRPRVLAAVVRMIDKAHLRVGNRTYAKGSGARGATTLTPDHVELERFTVSLDFPGKGGKQRQVEFRDRKTAKVIERCEEIDGQYLFCYVDDSGEEVSINSSSVNEYLREVAGEPVTAKDFRTWWGSVLALSDVADPPITADLPKRTRKKRALRAIDVAAEELGNTRAVCRSSYVHPQILAAAESGEIGDLLKKISDHPSVAELTAEETRFAALLPHLQFC